MTYIHMPNRYHWKATTALLFFAVLVFGLYGCDDPAPKPDIATDTNAVLPSANIPADGETPALASAPPELASDSTPLKSPEGEAAFYGIRSGIVRMRYTGAMSGTQTIYFKDYGRYVRREDSMVGHSQNGATAPRGHSVTITTPDFIGTVDLDAMFGWKAPNQGMKDYLNSDSSTIMSMGEYFLAKMAAKQLPDTTINGYMCKVRKMSSPAFTSTWWVWRGIIIRQLNHATQDNVTYMLEPVEIIPNPILPSNIFTLPETARIMDRNSPPPPGLMAPPPPDK